MIQSLKFAAIALAPALCWAQNEPAPDPCPELFSAADFFAANAKGEAAFADLDAEALEAAYLESKNALFLRAGEPLPAWGVESGFSKERLRKPALAATAISTVATGVFWGLSWKNRLLFDGEIAATPCSLGPDQCLDQYRDKTNAMELSSLGAGAITLGFGGLTVYTWWV
jgi:hypothetical protein